MGIKVFMIEGDATLSYPKGVDVSSWEGFFVVKDRKDIAIAGVRMSDVKRWASFEDGEQGAPGDVPSGMEDTDE